MLMKLDDRKNFTRSTTLPAKNFCDMNADACDLIAVADLVIYPFLSLTMWFNY